MERACVIVAAAASAAAVHAQTFQHIYGTQREEVVNDLVQAVDLGFAHAGQRIYPVGGPLPDNMVIKTRADGSIDWDIIYSTEASETLYTIVRTSDGGYAAAGENLLGGAAASTGIHLIKLDPNGAPMFAWRYRGTAFIDPAGVSVRQTEDGGYVIVGRLRPDASPLLFGVLIRTDSGGALLYERIYTIPGSNTARVSFSDIRQNNNGGFTIAGWVSEGDAPRDMLLLRVDSAGVPLVAARIGRTAFDERGDGLALVGGDPVINGSTNEFGAAPAMMIWRGTPALAPAWAAPNVYRPFANSYQAINVDGERNLICTGATADGATPDAGMIVVKPDGTGVLLTGAYGFPTTADGATAGIWCDLAEPGYALTGATLTAGWGLTDVYGVKTDSSGVSGCNERTYAPARTTPQVPWVPIELVSTFSPEQLPYPIQTMLAMNRDDLECFDPPCPPCAADYDQNGGVDGGDLAAFFADFEAGETCADVDGNGGVDGGDLAFFFMVFEAGGC
jgi:hypothetical protein